MGRTYTKIDENNVAVIETVENRTVLNKKVIQDQRDALVKKQQEDLKILDEALSQFTE